MSNSLYPCLWFDGQAKNAAEYYCSVFNNSAIVAQSEMVVTFELNGRKFMGLNGGPKYKLSPAFSIVVECDSQEEIDWYWDKLGAGGKTRACGWLDDKYGVSWQIVPSVLPVLMADATRAPRVMEIVQRTVKFNIQELLDA